MRNAIYFIAVLPPKEIRKEINIFQNYAASYFETKHALNSPPHITVFPPFRWSEAEEDKIEESVEDLAANNNSFYIQLENFGNFAPKVIYINVNENDELKKLHLNTISKMYTSFELENKSPHQFTPHITVAFRDLKRTFFLKAWSHFANTKYERAFSADKLALLKHEDGKWNIISEFELSN